MRLTNLHCFIVNSVLKHYFHRQFAKCFVAFCRYGHRSRRHSDFSWILWWNFFPNSSNSISLLDEPITGQRNWCEGILQTFYGPWFNGNVTWLFDLSKQWSMLSLSVNSTDFWRAIFCICLLIVSLCFYRIQPSSINLRTMTSETLLRSHSSRYLSEGCACFSNCPPWQRL